jgi:amino acid adenylation domain-containing protein
MDFNNTAGQYHKNKTLHQLVEEQAARTPDNIAVVFEHIHLTYKELDEKSNRLAHLLRKQGVKPDTIVGIIIEPSMDMVLGVLGILKAGGAYLPIEPSAPPERIVSVLKDGRASVLLTKEENIKKLSHISLMGLNDVSLLPYISTPREQVKDLDSLQAPDRSLVDYEIYNRYIGQAMMRNSITLQFSRGCAYNCAYCFKIWQDQYVIRSAENLFNEMMIYYNMGVRRFAFVDDLPNLNVEVGTRLYRLIIENGLTIHIHYVNGIRGDILTREYIDLMVEAGTVVMDLALETNSKRLQKLIRKHLNLKKLHENIQYILDKHPHVILETALLHGIPTETPEEARASLNYLKSLKWIHFPYIHVLKIYPNTAMADIALKNGIGKEAIRRSSDLAYHELPETLPFSKDFTRQYQSEFLNDYFLCKERLLSVLPQQMKVFTEEELVQAYNGYLPVKITSFADFLAYAGINREEVKGEFLPEDFGKVENLNKKLERHFRSGKKPPQPDALRILLLDLSQYFTHDSQNMVYDVVEPPLGLMYLMTHLNKTFGSRVKGKISKSRIDFDSFEELKSLVQEFNPDVIGIRTLNFYRDFFHKSVSLLRQWGVTVPIIAGGPYATSSYASLLMDKHIQLAVLGEGEITLAELVRSMLEHHKKLPAQETLKSIPGIAFIENRQKLAQEQCSRDILLLDQLPRGLPDEPGKNLPTTNRSIDMAYIIYTSGSTGNPRGVLVKHHNVINQLAALRHGFAFDDSRRYLLLSAFTFDVSVMHMFSSLTTGAQLFVISDQVRKDPERLWRFIHRHHIDILNTVPSYMKVLLEGISQDMKPVLRYLFLGGEALPRQLYRQVRESLQVEKIINIYGPTETTINATVYECGPKDVEGAENSFIPIGKPVMNYKAYILDKDYNVMPVGCSGELCIAGEGVARGYLNHPELTNDKFCLRRPGGTLFEKTAPPGPPRKNFSLPYSPIYRTGDLARWLANGNIQFLGRIDQQVKLRGFRIEPGEITNQILNYPGVEEAVVTVNKDNTDNPYLCAYYVDKSGTRAELWPSIGEYFIWDELMYHAMTHDELRNKSFKRAIGQAVRDKVVVDVGTGRDAILARFCARAGARKVYAVELLEEYCRIAENIIKQQGLQNKITVIQGDITKIQLPEKVDVVVANQCGTIGSSEGGIYLHNHARRFLKSSRGPVIPKQCITKITAVSMPEILHQTPGFSELTGNYAEKIFKKFKKTFELRLCIKNFSKSQIISTTDIFEHLDFSNLIEENAVSDINLEIKRNARMDGFLLWINLYTMEDEIIDTLENEYVWLPLFIPVFYPGVEVVGGDTITARCQRVLSSDGFTPDYFIHGVLTRQGKENITFNYDLSRIKEPGQSNTVNQNPFYRKLFPTESNRTKEPDRPGETVKINYIKNMYQPVRIPELREYLSRQLPDYMIPSYFVPLEKIPLTRSNKIDLRALPEPRMRGAGETYTAPETDLQYKLVDIWSDVLKVPAQEIGIDANFFTLGGHSLKATIALARTHKVLKAKIPLAQLFRTPTIRGLSRFLQTAANHQYNPLKNTEKKEYYDLSSTQKRLYILYQMDPGSTAYNMPEMLLMEGDLDAKRFRETTGKLIKRH